MNEVLSDVYHDFENTLRRHRISEEVIDVLPLPHVADSNHIKTEPSQTAFNIRGNGHDAEVRHKNSKMNGGMHAAICNGNGPVLLKPSPNRPQDEIMDEVDFRRKNTITRLSPSSPPGE